MRTGTRTAPRPGGTSDTRRCLGACRAWSRSGSWPGGVAATSSGRSAGGGPSGSASASSSAVAASATSAAAAALPTCLRPVIRRTSVAEHRQSVADQTLRVAEPRRRAGEVLRHTLQTMRTVAVDANPVARPAHTGTEVYAREVAGRLPAAAPDLRFVLYASRPGDVEGCDLTVLPGRRLWSQGRLCRELWLSGPDLFFAPAHVVPFLAPGRTLTVVHDLAFERFPGAYRPAALAYLRLTTRWAERRC